MNLSHWFIIHAFLYAFCGLLIDNICYILFIQKCDLCLNWPFLFWIYHIHLLFMPFYMHFCGLPIDTISYILFIQKFDLCQNWSFLHGCYFICIVLCVEGYALMLYIFLGNTSFCYYWWCGNRQSFSFIFSFIGLCRGFPHTFLTYQESWLHSLYCMFSLGQWLNQAARLLYVAFPPEGAAVSVTMTLKLAPHIIKHLHGWKIFNADVYVIPQ